MKRLSKEYKNVSLSEGTMREQDLIPCFVDFLKEHNHPGVKEIDCLAIEYYTDESSDLLNEDLFNWLNEIAPDGCYFGSHPGDGSDYGFWECEEEY